MSSAPRYDDWKALRLAALALIAAGVTGHAKAFLKAVREARAAPIVLLFALARSLWPEVEAENQTEWKPYKPPGPSRLSGLHLDRSEDAWRNRPAVAFRLEGRTAASPKPRPAVGIDPKRLTQRVTHAFQVLQRLLSLCEDPDAHAARLRRRLDRVDAPLIAVEAKAFAINARAQARRNRDARRLIDRAWRGRRRRESG